MVKLETIFGAMTWGLIALLVAGAFGAATPVDRAPSAHLIQLA